MSIGANILIIIIMVAVLISFISSGQKIARQQKAERDTFMGRHDGWDIYASPYGKAVIAIEHNARKIAIGTLGNYIEKDWSDINSVEVEKDGQSIQQTNRGSQALGAAIGTLLMPGVGTLLGGLTGSKRQRERINELSLKVVMDDRAAPVHRVIFFQQKGSGVDPKSELLKAPAAKLDHFHALISNAIRSHNQARHVEPQQALPDGGDLEARIEKLWELHQAGAITADEFATRKAALLSPQAADPHPAPRGPGRFRSLDSMRSS